MDVNSLLYDDNNKFISGELTVPVNEKVILLNLKSKHNVTSISLGKRLMYIIGLIICTVFFSWAIVSSVIAAIRLRNELGTWTPVINGGLIVVGFGVGLIITIYNLYLLISSRRESVEQEYKRLIREGSICSAKLVKYDVVNSVSLEISYMFELSNNKIHGKYLIPAMQVSNLKSRSLTVLYVNNDIHTLL